MYSKTITRDYATTGVVGRNTGFHISTEYDVDYAYDTYGRFSTITNDNDVYTYGYLANSDLIASLTYPNNIKTDNTYEAHRDLVTQVKNTYNTSTTISQYDYTYDAIGRRVDVDWSGTAFSSSDTITYGYNDRNEVTSADATNNANYNFSFSFDNIGNRGSYTTYETGSSVTSAYTVNNLNQYTAITNPSQSPTYDDDGEMTSDGTWSFTWNAENRLIAAEKSDAKLEFARIGAIHICSDWCCSDWCLGLVLGLVPYSDCRIGAVGLVPYIFSVGLVPYGLVPYIFFMSYGLVLRIGAVTDWCPLRIGAIHIFYVVLILFSIIYIF